MILCLLNHQSLVKHNNRVDPSSSGKHLRTLAPLVPTTCPH